MALIYQKTVSDKTLILAPREFYLRPFDFHNDWTEMRFGIYLSGVTSGGDDTTAGAESVTLSTAADRIAIGIKDSATNDLPGFGAALFLGGVTATGQTSDSSSSQFTQSGSSGLCAAGYHETTLVGGTVTLGNSLAFPAASGSTGYCGFYAIKFVITNRGAASQAVAISSVGTTPIAGTDYSAQALRLLINNATYNSPTTIAWNDGAVARTIPNSIFIRMPFYSNRIRISAMRAIRYAP
jgi:hypothetical protein